MDKIRIQKNNQKVEHNYEPTLGSDSFIESDKHCGNESELSDSFFEDFQANFMVSKATIHGDNSMNYSNTNGSKMNLLSNRSNYPPKPINSSRYEVDDEVISLNKKSAVAFSQLENCMTQKEEYYSNFQEELMNHYQSEVLSKIEYYSKQLSKFAKEVELERQESERKISFYKSKLEEHSGQCGNQNEDISRLASIFQEREEELEEGKRKTEIELVMEEIVGKVERNELLRTNKEAQCKIEEIQKKKNEEIGELERICKQLRQDLRISQKEKESTEKSMDDFKRNFQKIMDQMKDENKQKIEEALSKQDKQVKELQAEILVLKENEYQAKKNEENSKKKEIQKQNLIEELEKKLSEKDISIKEKESWVENTKNECYELKIAISRLQEEMGTLDNKNKRDAEDDEQKNREDCFKLEIQQLKKEIENQNELITQQKRTIQRDRIQKAYIAKKVDTSALLNIHNKSVQLPDEKKESTAGEIIDQENKDVNESGIICSNLNHMKSVKRKHKSIDITGKSGQIGMTKLINYDQNQSIICMESIGGVSGDSSIKPNRRSISMMNCSLISEEEKNAISLQEERKSLLIQKKEIRRKREDIKEKMLTFKQEFKAQNQRSPNKQDMKAQQNLLEEYHRLTVSVKQVEEKINMIEQHQQSILHNNSSINNSHIQSQQLNTSTNPHNQSTNIFADSSICKNIDNSVISDLSNNTSCVRQPIFKSTNPLLNKHLGLTSSQFTQGSTMIDHNSQSTYLCNISTANQNTLLNNQNTLLHNISANLADSSNIFSQSVANNSTSVSHIQGSSIKGDSDAIKGLKLEINNLQNVNKSLRDQLLNQKDIHQYEKEINDKQEQIHQLQEELSSFLREKQQNDEKIIEMQETINLITIKLQSETKERKQLHNIVEDLKGKVRVFCRVRPPNESEMSMNSSMVVEIQDNMTMQLQTKNGPKKFQFDSCLGYDSTQEEIFEDVKRLIQSAVDGYNVCIFAYGQTGSGKTYTMQGTKEDPGITPRSISELFSQIQIIQKSCKVHIKAHLVELYKDTLVDLLNPTTKDGSHKKLEIKEDQISNNIYIQNVTMENVFSREELDILIKKGMQNRKISKTDMNAESSRSHLIISILLSIYNPQTEMTTHGKLSLIDLAGSERINKSNTTSNQIKEAQAINKSLTALGDVISALTSTQPGEKFIPYRNNKLTYLMKDSLGGNAKTLMFVNVSPSEYNQEETQSSLFYASRVKTIVNDSTRNIESKESARLKEKLTILTQENEKLHSQISQQHSLVSSTQQQQQQLLSNSQSKHQFSQPLSQQSQQPSQTLSPSPSIQQNKIPQYTFSSQKRLIQEEFSNITQAPLQSQVQYQQVQYQQPQQPQLQQYQQQQQQQQLQQQQQQQQLHQQSQQQQNYEFQQSIQQSSNTSSLSSQFMPKYPNNQNQKPSIIAAVRSSSSNQKQSKPITNVSISLSGQLSNMNYQNNNMQHQQQYLQQRKDPQLNKENCFPISKLPVTTLGENKNFANLVKSLTTSHNHINSSRTHSTELYQDKI